MPDIKMMPHNIEAEQACLGCILLDSQVQGDILATIRDNDFYSEAHQQIYRSMLKIYQKSIPVDFVTLADQLEKDKAIEKVGGIEYITFLTNAVPSAANFSYYCDIVKSESIRRKLIRSGQEIIENTYNEEDKDKALSFGEKTIFEIAEKEERSSLEHVGKPGGAVQSVISTFDKIAKDPSAITGIPTGLRDFDAITNGLQNSDLILLAARPSVGKTSLAMNIVVKAAIEGRKCAVFSLEMSREQLMQRAICSLAKVSMSKALNGTMTPEEWQRIWAASKKLEQSGLYVDESSLTTPMDILQKCRRLKAKENIELIMVDYIQLMSSGSSKNSANRSAEVSDISRALKIAAKELNVPVIALSQLSRAPEMRQGDHRPMLSDLRDSGAIEQDADIVMFLYNPEKYPDVTQEDEPGTVELILAKHRRGRTGTVKLRWIGEYTTFVNYGDKSIQVKKETPKMAEPPKVEEALEEVDVDVFDD